MIFFYFRYADDDDAARRSFACVGCLPSVRVDAEPIAPRAVLPALGARTPASIDGRATPETRERRRAITPLGGHRRRRCRRVVDVADCARGDGATRLRVLWCSKIGTVAPPFLIFDLKFASYFNDYRFKCGFCFCSCDGATVYGVSRGVEKQPPRRYRRL